MPDATISERGGVITSFMLKNYRQENNESAPGVELVKTAPEQGMPLTVRTVELDIAVG